MEMEQTQCTETSVYKIQTPGNCPEESMEHSEHGESLISVKTVIFPPNFNATSSFSTVLPSTLHDQLLKAKPDSAIL